MKTVPISYTSSFVKKLAKYFVVNSLDFYTGCLDDNKIVSVKAEWTLENLLRDGEGNKVWNCDWKLRKRDDGSRFKVPADGSLKGSVIQVGKAIHLVFKTWKLRR